MHSAIVVSDEGSLEELNQLLSEGGWWVHQTAAGPDGSWLVVLTDHDPDCAHSEEDEEEYEDEEDEELEVEDEE